MNCFSEKHLLMNTRVFGCMCYVRNASKHKDKFDPRAEQRIFVGYPIGQKGWRVYNLRTNEFSVSRDVIFYENVFPCVKNAETELGTAPTNILQQPAQFPEEEDTSQQDDQVHSKHNKPGQERKQHDAGAETTDSLQSEGENAAVLPQQDTPVRPRARHPPAYLKDYFCHSAVQNPTF